MGDVQASLEARQGRPNTWHTDLPATAINAPLFCCFSIFCPWCVSYKNRVRLLHGDMDKYECCMGDCPCSGRMGEKDCPQLCLATEVCCCFAQSVVSTRWHLQDSLDINNTTCDNCIMGTMVALQQLACCCSILACLTDNEGIDSAAEITRLAADIMYCSVCSCMQTQVNIEMNENALFKSREQGHMPPPNVAPPTQEMALPGGYAGAPPPAYAGATPPGYPGAPPPGYPAP